VSEPVTFAQALRFWWKLGWISFGGPTGQIAVMHTEIVERRRWIDEPRFLHALNYCMLLPGPEAQQLATYIGWMLHGTRGALAAGILFVLPSAFLLWGLSWAYAAHGNLPWMAAIFAGLKPAVVGIVAHAVLRMGGRALGGPVQWALAAAAFAALYFARAPFPVVIAGAAVVGWVGQRLAPRHFERQGAHGSLEPGGEPGGGPGQGPASKVALRATGGWKRAARVTIVCLLLWWLPVAALALAFGPRSTFAVQGVFFSQAALVTFGGAYSVLPYVASASVERFGWLSAGSMLDGLGLAETTPGPLIMVVQFVGFLGGWNYPGGLEPWQGGLLGACITTWVTFVPCFLWILLGAPHMEALRERRGLSAALSSITAAVVGVVLHLALWFAVQALFPGAKPSWKALDPFAAVLAVGSFLVLARTRLGVPWIVVGGGLLGLGRLLWA